MSNLSIYPNADNHFGEPLQASLKDGPLLLKPSAPRSAACARAPRSSPDVLVAVVRAQPPREAVVIVVVILGRDYRHVRHVRLVSQRGDARRREGRGERGLVKPVPGKGRARRRGRRLASARPGANGLPPAAATEALRSRRAKVVTGAETKQVACCRRRVATAHPKGTLGASRAVIAADVLTIPASRKSGSMSHLLDSAASATPVDTQRGAPVRVALGPAEVAGPHPPGAAGSAWQRRHTNRSKAWPPPACQEGYLLIGEAVAYLDAGAAQ